jgi:23S rRNA pseudouridine2457 synthase
MTNFPHQYFVLNKPAGIVSQFISDSPRVSLLGDIEYDFPEGTHAIGRLDSESEGLLLLTTNKKITGLLFHPNKKHVRTYLVMVKGNVSEETLQQLKTGVSIKIQEGKFHQAVPAGIEIIPDPLSLCPFAQDERCNYPHTWLLISLTEGKYHQVRKMVLSVKHRCLRLIRLSIEDMYLEKINPGEVKEFSEDDFFRLLHLEEPS